MAVIFKYIFVNENVWISIKISLNAVPYGSVDNIPVLAQIMARFQTQTQTQTMFIQPK